MRAVDMDDRSGRHLKALVYGGPGTGKTDFGVSAPRPLILLNEEQAIPNILAAAARRKVPKPTVLKMDKVADYRSVARAFHGDPAKPFVVRDDEGKALLEMEQWPETLVMDSVTEAVALISDEIREQSPPRVGSDGLPVDSDRYWNVLRDRAIKLFRTFRDIRTNTLFLALLDDREVEDRDTKAKHRVYGPQLAMRALPSALMSVVNVVGVTFRRRKPVKVNGQQVMQMEYGIGTAGPDWMALKPFPPLRDAEVTNFSSWCDRVRGVDDGSVPPAPLDAPAQALPDIVDQAPAA